MVAVAAAPAIPAVAAGADVAAAVAAATAPTADPAGVAHRAGHHAAAHEGADRAGAGRALLRSLALVLVCCLGVLRLLVLVEADPRAVRRFRDGNPLGGGVAPQVRRQVASGQGPLVAERLQPAAA